ncbi:MAG: RNA polymerase sigma factor FliA [Betaproteobacteria bacterium]
MYQAAGTLDMKRYVQEYSPLVKRMAHHLLTRLPPSVQIDDMIQAGMMGLMDAVTRYESTQGAQFETYASQRIRGAMLDELRGSDWLPRGLRRKQRTIEQALSRLEQMTGRAPGEREVAAELGMSLEAYQEMLAESRGAQLIYAEDFGDRESGDSLFDNLSVDADAEPFAELADGRLRSAVAASIGMLPEREKSVMGLYYEQDLNFREIAAVLEVTESRVCQLHSQAIARLRARLRDW